ncbi:hypothetical protein LZ32DRAFT_597844 [Colletotrichum eremochloae]|nr:hypothetical protein LZ32DRAFT_597844 [Colletotrichum eremochloae]
MTSPPYLPAAEVNCFSLRQPGLRTPITTTWSAGSREPIRTLKSATPPKAKQRPQQ